MSFTTTPLEITEGTTTMAVSPPPSATRTSDSSTAALPPDSKPSPPKATTSYYSFNFPDFTVSTNLGPLTSRLKFSEACYENLIDMEKDGLGPSGAWKTIGCAVSTCCPSSNFYTQDWAYMSSYYSPGVCPMDYQSCDPPTQSGLSLTPKVGEEIVFCCPNNCICPNDEDLPMIIPGGCGSRLTSGSISTFYTLMKDIHDHRSLGTEVYTFEPGFTEELQIAYPIQIRFPATESSNANPSSDPQLTSVPLTTATISGAHSGKPILSTGAIIGVAFGGFFSIFLACTLAYLLLKRQHRARTEAQRLAAGQQYNDGRINVPELSYDPTAMRIPTDVYGKTTPHDIRLEQNAPLELPSTPPPEINELSVNAR